MKQFSVLLMMVCFALPALFAANKTKPSDSSIYVITNDDGLLHSYATFFLAGGTQGAPTLMDQRSVNTQGFGIGGGFFGTSRVAMLPSSSAQCVYVSDAASGDIAAIDIGTQQLVGNFTGSTNDNGNSNGIGMAMNQNYLYAGYTQSNTIATFSVGAGCQLTFLGDITVNPLNGGWIDGMALNGNMLVVTYIDGSIQSFNTANGIPISNNDEQNTAGYAADYLANGVDITQDGHFAIFGDTATTTVVEVSDLSSGKLAPTVVYIVPQQPSNAIGPAISSSTVRLSPDQSLLYIANSQLPYVTAAFFNKTTGKVSAGCTSPTLNLFYNPWSYVGSLQTRDTTGTGNVLYLAEFGGSYIGILAVTSTGTSCALTEAPSSPVNDELSPGLISIQVFPPRPF